MPATAPAVDNDRLPGGVCPGPTDWSASLGVVAGYCTLILTGAPLTARGADIASGLVRAGWQVRVVVTPASVPWVDGDAITKVTGTAPQREARAAGQPKAPRPDVLVIAPATFNTINKLAGGIADTFAHSTACEALGAGTPTVVVPMVSGRLWGHPALANSLRTLQTARVRFVGLQGVDGAPRAVDSEAAGDIVASFDPAWIAEAIRQLVKSS